MPNFPIEQYLESMKQRQPDAAYIAPALAGGIDSFSKARDDKRTMAASAAQKLIGAGYQPVVDGKPIPGDTLMQMITNGVSVPNMTWEKAPKDEDSLDMIREKAKARAEGTGAALIPGYKWDPIKGEYTKEGMLEKGAIVRQTQVTPEERAGASRGIVPASEAGRMVLAQQSLSNIEDVKKMLFPTGSPDSYNSALALKSRIPLIGAMPKDEQAQQIFRKLSDSLGGKVLIQTGVAARPEEVKSEYKKFYSSVLSNPKAAYDGFTQLQDFYKGYIDTVQGKALPENPRPFTNAETFTDEDEARYQELLKKAGK